MRYHIPLLAILALVIFGALLVIFLTKFWEKKNSSLQTLTTHPTNTPFAQVYTPTVTPTPTATTDRVLNQTNGSSSAKTISDYIYPGARVVSQADNQMVLSSQDDVNKITDWYKQNLEGMNNKSYVNTNTNGEVLNKLLANQTGNYQVSVEISKKPVSKTTNISLEITYP